MNSLISIIIPVYNVEKYLSRCIDSILNQTYKNLEIILVDDGSPDNCGAICDEYALKDNRIKILHLKNGGPSYARNKGIEIATGDYIGFVDADDYIDENMFNKMLLKQKEVDADIVCCNHTLVYYDNKIKKLDSVISNGFVNKDSAMKLAITELSFGAFLWNKLFKKEMLYNFKLKEGIFYEDYDAGTRLIANAGKIFYICDNLYFYFQGNPNSTTHQHNYSKVLDHFNVAIDVVNLCKKSNLNESLYYAKRRLIKVSISLLGIIYLNKLEEEKKEELKKLKNTIVSNLKILCFSNIAFMKKIFCLLFLISPSIIKHIRKFL